MYETILGRTEEEKEKLGTYATVYLGKQYVKMGQVTSLSHKVYMDVSRSHVVFIAGKRGSGKSYSMGVIAEGVSDLPEEVRKNLSIIMLDTMGIYWTMRYPNKKEALLLEDWGIEPHPLNVRIFTPVGFFKEYRQKGIPTDFPFSIQPSEIDASEWLLMFDIHQTDPVGVLIERVVNELKESGENYGMKDIIDAISGDERSEKTVKDAAENRFLLAEQWGLFSKQGTRIEDLAAPGQITVLDVSCYTTLAGGDQVRALVIGLISEKLFLQRMVSRKSEEFKDIEKKTSLFVREEEGQEDKEPLVWLVVDEAHEFLPNKGKSAASKSLITILREGRQPGISLVLATQQPGKIHSDVITQSDIVIAHHLTANIDVEALGALMQSYMREGLGKQLAILPKESGAAVVFDDTNERIFPIRVRPRYTWHGGESPSAISKWEKKTIEI
ncbi:TPA: ATP-binding protein [Candidatus Woesearchaeota archaeon]|nr:ATP-binding protein [Candidatus Woesearchaeota archaeon]